MARIYAQIMGDAFATLAEPVQRFHAATGRVEARGDFAVIRGPGLPGRVAAAMMGLVKAGAHVDTRLSVTHSEAGEAWHRRFAGAVANTTQRPGRRAGAALLIERVGLVELAFLLQARAGAMIFVFAGACLALGPWRLRLPRWLGPIVEAEVSAASADSLSIDVRMRTLWAGQILRYAGVLTWQEHRP